MYRINICLTIIPMLINSLLFSQEQEYDPYKLDKDRPFLKDISFFYNLDGKGEGFTVNFSDNTELKFYKKNGIKKYNKIKKTFLTFQRSEVEYKQFPLHSGCNYSLFNGTVIDTNYIFKHKLQLELSSLYFCRSYYRLSLNVDESPINIKINFTKEFFIVSSRSRLFSSGTNIQTGDSYHLYFWY